MTNFLLFLVLRELSKLQMQKCNFNVNYMLMFFLQSNSTVVMLMGILFPNLIKKWLFESLQRPCNILYLLHHHSSIFIDTSTIFQDTKQHSTGASEEKKPKNKKNQHPPPQPHSPCKGSIRTKVKCVLGDSLLLPRHPCPVIGASAPGGQCLAAAHCSPSRCQCWWALLPLLWLPKHLTTCQRVAVR